MSFLFRPDRAPTVTMLGWYFEKRRPVANVLASTGESILSFILTPSIQFMVDQYSWRGAMLILGALQLNLCLCRALLRPLNRHVPPKELIEEKEHELELLSQTYTDSKSSNNRSDSKKSDPLKVKIIRYMDYTLIANARFMVYSVFGVFAALGFFAPSLFLVPYARSQGMEEYQAAALMSISAVLDLLGWVLLFGWVANLRLVETVHQLIVTVILLGIVLLLCPLATTFTQLLFSAGYGLVFGATVAIYITVLAEVEFFSQEHLPKHGTPNSQKPFPHQRQFNTKSSRKTSSVHLKALTAKTMSISVF
ncbi:monocarboxylate transporter 2-like [Sinocyclocheilus rhinocerous]|uniref:monocarboxylate transporter 2-like n=1 Tax=Sinocyclocheilus rhinocerous TaxID=307959 RepID=UPI0007BA08D2|nr:PREDICTED: monocarboxylate transporter 2-like [Sinocyclocheilus rhinocerous]